MEMGDHEVRVVEMYVSRQGSKHNSGHTADGKKKQKSNA